MMGFVFRGLKMPEGVRLGIERHVLHGLPTGSFVHAVLCNDLKEACIRADDDNIMLLPVIVAYCYNEIPGASWGSPERVEEWKRSRSQQEQQEVSDDDGTE